jgi:hypothetical protein
MIDSSSLPPMFQKNAGHKEADLIKEYKIQIERLKKELIVDQFPRARRYYLSAKNMIELMIQNGLNTEKERKELEKYRQKIEKGLMIDKKLPEKTAPMINSDSTIKIKSPIIIDPKNIQSNCGELPEQPNLDNTDYEYSSQIFSQQASSSSTVLKSFPINEKGRVFEKYFKNYSQLNGDFSLIRPILSEMNVFYRQFIFNQIPFLQILMLTFDIDQYRSIQSGFKDYKKIQDVVQQKLMLLHPKTQFKFIVLLLSPSLSPMITSPIDKSWEKIWSSSKYDSYSVEENSIKAFIQYLDAKMQCLLDYNHTRAKFRESFNYHLYYLLNLILSSLIAASLILSYIFKAIHLDLWGDGWNYLCIIGIIVYLVGCSVQKIKLYYYSHPVWAIRTEMLQLIEDEQLHSHLKSELSIRSLILPTPPKRTNSNKESSKNLWRERIKNVQNAAQKEKQDENYIERDNSKQENIQKVPPTLQSSLFIDKFDKDQIIAQFLDD